MSDMFEKIASQVPSLAVLCYLVYIFLKHLKGRDELIKEINKENVEARLHSSRVIEENTRAAGMNTATMNEMTSALRELSRKTQSNTDKR